MYKGEISENIIKLHMNEVKLACSALHLCYFVGALIPSDLRYRCALQSLLYLLLFQQGSENTRPLQLVVDHQAKALFMRGQCRNKRKHINEEFFFFKVLLDNKVLNTLVWRTPDSFSSSVITLHNPGQGCGGGSGSYPVNTGHELKIHPEWNASPQQSTIHTQFTHSLTPMGNLAQPIHLLVCFWEFRGNLRTQRKPLQIWRENGKLYTDNTLSCATVLPETLMGHLNSAKYYLYS